MVLTIYDVHVWLYLINLDLVGFRESTIQDRSPAREDMIAVGLLSG